MFDNVSEWTFTVFEPDKYMEELLNYPEAIDEEIVVVGSKNKSLPNAGKTILAGGNSYSWVGFRYVLTYKDN